MWGIVSVVFGSGKLENAIQLFITALQVAEIITYDKALRKGVE